MESETRLIKTESNHPEIDNSESIEKELELAMEKHEKLKRSIDVFFLGLFIVFIIYTII